MHAKIHSSALAGINACKIEVEVNISAGLPAVIVVGLPDEAVRESRERVKTAIQNTDFAFPAKRITINLAPADIKKEGPSFDLPIAVGILRCLGHIDEKLLDDFILVGELALDGRVRPTKGILPIAVLARQTGKKLIVPEQNAAEATLVEGLDVFAVQTLCQTTAFLNSQLSIRPAKHENPFNTAQTEHIHDVDMGEIKGQFTAKRALEISVSGGHNVLLSGPPGTGKTMLASRVPTILPELSYEEALETSKIHSIMGYLTSGRHFITTRPFRSPHHTVSFAGLVGGGTVPRPGEVSLAHNGVLFLDELPEFKRSVLEALRQPLEDKKVTISRANGSMSFPANFMLIASQNPCPCGFLSHPEKECSCTGPAITRYLSRVSGPLMDRIDLQIEVPPLESGEILSEKTAESSAAIRKRTTRARKIQQERFKDFDIFTNSQMSEKHMKIFCKLDNECKKLMETAIDKMGISARAYSRIRKVARTIADLAESENITLEHLAEAVQYRLSDPAQTAYL